MHPFPKVIALMVFFAAHATWSAFDVDAPDSASARVNYGIRTLSNSASTTSVKVKDGVVVFSAALASDSTEGYTANVALEVPLCLDGRTRDLRGFKSLRFQYRNSERITDYLNVSFGSPMDKPLASGLILPEFAAGIAGTNALAAGTAWKDAEVLYDDFIVHFFVDPGPEYWAHFDSTFQFARSIRFAPYTGYSSSGTQNGTACNKCVGPTMAKQTLEIRNIAIYDKDSTRIELQNCANAATPPRLTRASFGASYRDGILAVERKIGTSTVDVISASGRRVASFAPHETRKRLALERGTWYLVERTPGKAPISRSLAVVR